MMSTIVRTLNRVNRILACEITGGRAESRVRGRGLPAGTCTSDRTLTATYSLPARVLLKVHAGITGKVSARSLMRVGDAGRHP